MNALTSPKFPIKVASAIALSAVSLLLASCFYMPGVSGRPAKAGLSINRALLPSNVSSFALIVGGPGMSTITAQYPAGTTSATLSVPSGVARTFTVLANTPSVTFQGVTTVDLAPDETKDISVTPVLFASQILIPDANNFSLVQISDMSGTGWKTAGFSSQPYDVDFDDQGRIYVANGNSIAIMNDITDPAPTTITADVSSIQSIAIDRPRGILYLIANGNGLWSVPLSPLGFASPLMTFEFARAVAVDSDGFIYVVAGVSSNIVEKIDPSSLTVVTDTSTTYTFNVPWDVLVNGDFVYVSDQADGKIVRLDKNLQSPVPFSGPPDNRLVGPERFVAILNKPITVIDEDSTTARVVTFNDMTGAGYTAYGARGYQGSGATGLFEFFLSS